MTIDQAYTQARILTTDEAYDACEKITSEQARNFSYGIRLLPAEKRRAMCALYAMARRIDDIGDGNAAAPEKLRSLAEVRKSISDLRQDPSSGGSDPVLRALADSAARFPLPMDALVELIEGCEMDVNGVGYRTFDDLVGYCRRVAGTVGRLSLAVYGITATADRKKAESLADSLGIALQITNILRDIVEDLETMGRVYLPAEDLDRFGVPSDLQGGEDNISSLIRFEASRARTWYSEGMQLLPMLDWRSRACTAAMAGIYRRLLDRIEEAPASVLRGRISLSGSQKARVAARALTRGTA
jgi:15-cis-phytoene synthase